MTDLVVAPFPRLHDPLGVGDQRPHERDAVGLVLLDDLLGLVGREDAVHGEDGRVAHRLLHRVRRVHAEAVRRVVRAHHADATGADADVEVVDEPQLLVPGCHLGAVVGGETRAVGLLVVADEADAHGDTVADGIAHRRHDLHAEAHPVLERAAVRVGAVVELRREELVEQVPVRALDLDPVEPARDGVARAPDVVVDRLGDVARVHRPRRLHVIGRHRRCDRDLLRPVAQHHRPGVRELDEGVRPVLVHLRGELLVVRDALGIPPVGVVRHLVRGVRCDRRLAGDHRCDLAAGAVGEVPPVPAPVEPGLAPHGVRLGEHREVGAEDHPVAQLERPHPERLEERVVCHGGRLSYPGGCPPRPGVARWWA